MEILKYKICIKWAYWLLILSNHQLSQDTCLPTKIKNFWKKPVSLRIFLIIQSGILRFKNLTFWSVVPSGKWKNFIKAIGNTHRKY